MSRHLRYFIPLVIFLIMGGFLFKGLYLDPRAIPSVLIDKPAPQFTLPLLKDPGKTFSTSDLKGKVWVMNIWATWCVSCRAEHAVLVEAARTGEVEIYGLNYKDDRGAAKAWLNSLGDPYVLNAFDEEGRVGIDWGAYGTPESFIVDKKGIIRHKFTGPIDRESLHSILLPMVKSLKAES